MSPRQSDASGDRTSDRVDALRLERDLRAALRGEVRFDRGSRALYASDASNYRTPPIGAVLPASVEDVLATLAIAHEHGVPVTPRGGGTSTAGNAGGFGIVLDCSRHLDHVLAVDPKTRTAQVEPGVILDDLQRAAGQFGLRFGPDPATHDRCTLGGMIGNNSCGSHSIRFGKTDDNVEALDVACYDGTRLTVSRLGATVGEGVAGAARAASTEAALAHIVARFGDDIRAATARSLPRRVSGYALEHLLPEKGGSIARSLVGSEGTCIVVLGATLGLVEVAAGRALLVLGFPDVYRAADFAPELLSANPLTVEGIDRRLVALAARRRDALLHRVSLPEGGAFLLVEMGGSDDAEAGVAAQQLLSRLSGKVGSPSGAVLVDRAAQGAVWRIREAGAGLATRLPDGGEAWPGWEDAAVPPEHLGSYLRRFDALLSRHGLQGLHYGHYGEGCVHVRINFDFLTPDGIAIFRRFVEDAADLVVDLGGSLSGEHGDGQARGELLERMYSPPMMEAFRCFKDAFDPERAFNPGRLIAPRALDSDLRVRPLRRKIAVASLRQTEESQRDLAVASRGCVGVGSCRRLDGGAMCPSFQVTRDEQHSTRGRARLFSEMLTGDLIDDGWRSSEVREALDLCLGCKACRVECPVGIDVASYKVEFLARHYRHRLRPRAHYALGYLPLVLQVGSLAPRLFNALVRAAWIGAAIRRLAGLEQGRDLPHLAPRRRTRKTPRARAGAPTAATTARFSDCFSRHINPSIAAAADMVLEASGQEAFVPAGATCCGLTWYSTGQLGMARAVLRRTLGLLAKSGATGRLVVLEPSCAAMLREEAPTLLGEEGRRLAERVVSLAEAIDPLTLVDRAHLDQTVVAQVHCHQHAGPGYERDLELLASLGAKVRAVETGCCGLAGNFGLEAGHGAVSAAIAERNILSRLSAGEEGEIVVADGFSCRTQIGWLSQHRPLHLAELLAKGLDQRTSTHSEQD